MAVPRFLDPEDQRTKKNGDGNVVVCYDGSKQAQSDYIFVGLPTPDMVPLDEEAEELSAIEAKRGEHPIETLNGQGSYQDDILKRFMDMLAAAQTNQKPAENISVAGVSAEAFAEMQAQVQALMESNAALQAQAAEREASSRRRV